MYWDFSSVYEKQFIPKTYVLLIYSLLYLKTANCKVKIGQEKMSIENQHIIYLQKKKKKKFKIRVLVVRPSFVIHILHSPSIFRPMACATTPRDGISFHTYTSITHTLFFFHAS